MTSGDTLCSEEGAAILELKSNRLRYPCSSGSTTTLLLVKKNVTSRNITSARKIGSCLPRSSNGKLSKFKVEANTITLVENMRREGFEVGVSKPTVIMREGGQSKSLTRKSRWTCEAYSGTVIQELNRRKRIMTSHESLGEGSASKIRNTYVAWLVFAAFLTRPGRRINFWYFLNTAPRRSNLSRTRVPSFPWKME